MAKYGAGCSVWLDVVDESQFFSDAGVDVSVDTAEVTTFQPGVSPAWKSYIEGLAVAKVTLKGYYDAVNDAAMMGDVRNGGSVLTVGPSGLAAIGDAARLVWVHDTSVGESSPIGGAVILTVAHQGDGVVGFGQCLHTMASVDTGTTTGPSRDDGAASATGWMAHLHITAVTGSPTSWTVKLQDSADNSTWADVAGGGFTATNVPLAQRLVSAPGAALRRYVRYISTVVGGTTPTLTFGIAYARNR